MSFSGELTNQGHIADMFSCFFMGCKHRNDQMPLVMYGYNKLTKIQISCVIKRSGDGNASPYMLKRKGN